MGKRIWEIPQDQFVAAWNSGDSLMEAAERVKALADGNAPVWAALARASALRKNGMNLRVHAIPPAKILTQIPVCDTIAS